MNSSIKIAILFTILILTNQSFAQEKPANNSLLEAKKSAESMQPEHLLDGTSMNYFYTNGGGIHFEFYDGMIKYQWIVGSRKGHGNKDLAYQSRKIGNKMYIVSWLEQSHPDYTTLVFNFNNNVMYSSGIFRFGSENQFTRFDGGIIENLILVEK